MNDLMIVNMNDWFFWLLLSVTPMAIIISIVGSVYYLFKFFGIELKPRPYNKSLKDITVEDIIGMAIILFGLIVIFKKI